MINADAINISVGRQAISITSGDGFLQLTRRGDRLTFGDFDNAYAVDNENFVRSYGENRIVKVDDGSGEPWELTSTGRVGGLIAEYVCSKCVMNIFAYLFLCCLPIS